MITPTPRRLPGYGGDQLPGGPGGPPGGLGKGGMPPAQLGPGSGTQMMPDPVPPDPMQQMMQGQQPPQMGGLDAPMNPQNVDPYLGTGMPAGMLQRRRLGAV